MWRRLFNCKDKLEQDIAEAKASDIKADCAGAAKRVQRYLAIERAMNAGEMTALEYLYVIDGWVYPNRMEDMEKRSRSLRGQRKRSEK
jgi:hypothetical protein